MRAGPCPIPIWELKLPKSCKLGRWQPPQKRHPTGSFFSFTYQANNRVSKISRRIDWWFRNPKTIFRPRKGHWGVQNWVEKSTDRSQKCFVVGSGAAFWPNIGEFRFLIMCRLDGNSTSRLRRDKKLNVRPSSLRASYCLNSILQ